MLFLSGYDLLEELRFLGVRSSKVVLEVGDFAIFFEDLFAKSHHLRIMLLMGRHYFLIKLGFSFIMPLYDLVVERHPLTSS